MSDYINRQKVLKQLDNADKFFDVKRTVENYKKLLTEWIKVLPSAVNKGDLISRQKVLNTLDFADNALTDEERTVENYKELLTECIKALPNVEVEPIEE